MLLQQSKRSGGDGAAAAAIAAATQQSHKGGRSERSSSSRSRVKRQANESFENGNETSLRHWESGESVPEGVGVGGSPMANPVERRKAVSRKKNPPPSYGILMGASGSEWEQPPRNGANGTSATTSPIEGGVCLGSRFWDLGSPFQLGFILYSQAPSVQLFWETKVSTPAKTKPKAANTRHRKTKHTSQTVTKTQNQNQNLWGAQKANAIVCSAQTWLASWVCDFKRERRFSLAVGKAVQKPSSA